MNPCTLAPVPTLRLPTLAESPSTWVSMALPVLLVLAIAGMKIRYRWPVVWLIAPLVSAIGIEVDAMLALGLSLPLQRRLIFWASAERAQLSSHGCSLAAFNAQYAAAGATAQEFLLIGTVGAFVGLAAMWTFVILRARRLSRGQPAVAVAGDTPE